MNHKNQSTLIHIGFPKTGSTFLQAYFENHPLIHHNRSRFQKYVNTGMITNEIVEELSENEVVDVLSEELLSIWSGDTSKVEFQTYNMDYDFESHQKQTIEQLHFIYPNAKILIVTRGYQSLMSSLYSQSVLSGNTIGRKNFIKKNEEIVLKLFNYNNIIALYSSIFSKNQLIILPFEWLQNNPEQFLTHLEKVIEVDHYEFSNTEVHGSIPKNLIFFFRVTTLIYKRYLSLFHKQKAQQKFLRYLEKMYHFKENNFAKLFKGKNKNFEVSHSFIEKFEINSSYLTQIKVFNSYISKYRK